MASVYFIGAGPGAIDLLTVRADRLIREADLILYADSLVNPEISGLAKPGARVVGSAKMSLGEIVEMMVEAAQAGEVVARVHSGDPSIYGAIREQMAALDDAGISYGVVPGVSSVFGAAAALRTELTLPEVSQTVILCRVGDRTPVPEEQSLPALARHNATLAIYLSTGMIDRVVAELLEGGYRPETPVAVVYRVSWPEEMVLRGTLADIGGAVRSAGIDRQALIMVGDALRPVQAGEGASKSLLYDAGFGHGYRSAASQ
ncbi:MAG TPA: precorrin-4 C(11)-methyltransferase [Chloroflexota bacterium]